MRHSDRLEHCILAAATLDTNTSIPVPSSLLVPPVVRRTSELDEHATLVQPPRYVDPP